MDPRLLGALREIMHSVEGINKSLKVIALERVIRGGGGDQELADITARYLYATDYTILFQKKEKT